MGTWGTGLYQDDTACEVRDDYVANLQAGLSDSAASRKILKGYGRTLRNTQVSCGRKAVLDRGAIALCSSSKHWVIFKFWGLMS
jgi:hypothetical protein